MIPLSPSLVYYYYFSSDDQENILLFKEGLKKAYGLVHETVHSNPEFYKGFRLLGSITGTDVAVLTLIWRNISLISLIISRPLEKWTESVEFQKKTKGEMDGPAEDLLGEGILFVAEKGGEIPRGIVERAYPVTEYARTDLKAGTLDLLKPWGKEYNIYGFIPSGDYEDFILGDMPFINAFAHKLEREGGLYRQQIRYMEAKRREIENRVGEIMGRPVLEDTEKRQGELEKEIHELSGMYSSLAVNSSNLKKTLANIRQDILNMEGRVETLLAKGGENAFSVELERYTYTKDQIKKEEVGSQLALERVKEAIDVVGTRVELLSSRESLNLQKERYNLQAAAGVIEVIIVFYYSLMVWKTLAPEKAFYSIPYYIKFSLTLVFAFSVFAFTHYSSHAMAKKEKLNKGTVVSVGLGILVLLVMHWISF